MINCVIIDDDPVASSLLKHYVNNTDGLSLTEVFNNSVEAANFLRTNAPEVDLIFLDIEMPDMTGIELLDTLQDLPPVILVSSKEQYAVKAFEYKVISYLVKPVDYSKFLKAVGRVFKQYEAQKGGELDYLFVKENGLLTKVSNADILYFAALGDYVQVHVKGRIYTISSTMKNLEEKLSHNKNFVRVHRSYMINLNFLENFDAEVAVVANKVIPIGNKYRGSLQNKLNIL